MKKRNRAKPESPDKVFEGLINTLPYVDRDIPNETEGERITRLAKEKGFLLQIYRLGGLDSLLGVWANMKDRGLPTHMYVSEHDYTIIKPVFSSFTKVLIQTGRQDGSIDFLWEQSE